MASIKKRGKTYSIRVSNGFDIDGKRIYECTTFKPDESRTPKQQEKDLQDFVYEFEKKVKEGKLLKGEKLTLLEFSKSWVEEYAKNSLEITTINAYQDMLKDFILPALGHLKISNINPLHLQTFYNNLLEDGVRKDGKKGGYSPSTIKKCHAILSSMLNDAVKWQMIDSNPCTKISPPKQKAEQEVKNFTEEQLNIFIDLLETGIPVKHAEHKRLNKDGSTTLIKEYIEYRQIQPQLQIYYYLSIFTGCRRGELLGLTWNDIDFKESTINITKELVYNNKELIIKAPKTNTSIRELKIPSFINGMLKEYKKEQLELKIGLGDSWEGDNFVFIQANGRPMHPSTPYHTFKKMIKNYNNSITEDAMKLPDIPLHGLRHTHATLLIADNIDVRTVSARLGHAKTSTTMNIYAHSLKKLDEQVADSLEEKYADKIRQKRFKV